MRLPAAFRFEGTEVFIRQDPETGDVILSRKPGSWDGFLKSLQDADAPADFLGAGHRDQGRQDRDPFQDWPE